MKSRRSWLKRAPAALAIGASTSCATRSPAQPAGGSAGRTFVFVPGTWHGGWAWTPVCERLRAMGHRAFAVTCTGVGERSHLADPSITAETHVKDVVQLIEYEELNNVVLVGHSFGGLTVTGVADALRERLDHLVFYDAFVPTRARPAWVQQAPDGSWPAWWEARRAKFRSGYLMDFFAEYPIEMLVDPVRYPQVAARLQRSLSLHPAGQWTTPVSFAHGGWEGLPRTYVHCRGQSFRRSSEAMWGPARAPGWQWIDQDTPRVGMLTHPQQTAELLAGQLADARSIAANQSAR